MEYASERTLLFSHSDANSNSNNDEKQETMELSERHVEVENVDRSQMSHTTSNMQTLVHVLKSMVGTGILAMPNAFLSSGLWLGLGLTITLGVICLHCMVILVKSSQTLCRRANKTCLDYGEVAELSLETGHKSLQRYSKCGRLVVNFFLGIMQFGVCSVYILFVAQNIKTVVDEYEITSFDVRLYMLAVTAVLIPFCLIRHLTILSFIMGVANVLLAVGLLIIAQYLLRDLPSVTERTAVNSTIYLPLYFGTVLFAFEGIGVVLPLENKMMTPEAFGGWCGVLTLGIMVSACLYTAFGFYGYLKLGNAVKASVSLNMPSGIWIYSMSTIMFAVAICLSYALQFYVAVSIGWSWLKHRTGHKLIAEYAFRTVCVLFTFFVAVLVPRLDLLISLLGAVGATTLTIILPPIIDMIVQGSDRSLTPLTIIKDVLLIILGVVGSVSGVIVSLQTLIRSYE